LLFPHFHQSPTLRLAQRAGFHDLHYIAHGALILFIMRMKLRCLFYELTVDGVFYFPLNSNGNGFIILLLLTTPVFVLRNFLSDIFDLLTFPAVVHSLNFLLMVRLPLVPLSQFRFQPGNILTKLPHTHRILQWRNTVSKLQLFQTLLVFLYPRFEVLHVHTREAVQKFYLL
jgi:hypothetical protein